MINVQLIDNNTLRLLATRSTLNMLDFSTQRTQRTACPCYFYKQLTSATERIEFRAFRGRIVCW